MQMTAFWLYLKIFVKISMKFNFQLMNLSVAFMWSTLIFLQVLCRPQITCFCCLMYQISLSLFHFVVEMIDDYKRRQKNVGIQVLCIKSFYITFLIQQLINDQMVELLLSLPIKVRSSFLSYCSETNRLDSAFPFDQKTFEQMPNFKNKIQAKSTIFPCHSFENIIYTCIHIHNSKHLIYSPTGKRYCSIS